MTQFNSLINDIYGLLEDPSYEVSEDNLEVFLENLGDLIRESFGGRQRRSKDKENKLYASTYGLPPRRLWYTVNAPKEQKKLKGSDQIRFLYGNILEELVLLFAKEAGHTVTEEQARVNVNGVSGKIDARIDGMLTDIKSASGFSFKKFKEGEFLTGGELSDPFAYKYQLGLYVDHDKDQEGAFVVINKENGELCSVILDNNYDIPDVHLKIEQAKIVIERDFPPEEKCYQDEPSGKSGNRILNKICSFCDFKEVCWKDSNEGKGLIPHTYASGPVYFSVLKRFPKTMEVDSSESSEGSNTEEPTTVAS